MSRPTAPRNKRMCPHKHRNPSIVAALLGAALTCALLLLALPGCKSVETRTQRIDQTDQRTAVQTENPDTIVVDRIRTDTVWMPGTTITWPEIVRVSEEVPTKEDTVDAFPLKELAVDSSHVRITGLTKEYTLPHPCFGERLLGRSLGGDVSFRVTGDCVPRDTVVKTRIERQSWFDRMLDRGSRWFSILVIIGLTLYVLRGTLSTAIRAAMPW